MAEVGIFGGTSREAVDVGLLLFQRRSCQTMEHGCLLSTKEKVHKKCALLGGFGEYRQTKT